MVTSGMNYWEAWFGFKAEGVERKWLYHSATETIILFMSTSYFCKQHIVHHTRCNASVRLPLVCVNLRCQALAQSGSDSTHIRQIRDFFRSDFSTFLLSEPKYTDIFSEKNPDLSHLGPI